jgi:uncharacterized protein (TIGR02001 family)
MSSHCQSRRLLALTLFILHALTGTARAQTSFDMTVVSQYAARGAALGSGPALQLRVEHDAESPRFAGWYVGAFASPATIEGRRQGQLIAYAGRAQRLTSTLSWDAGVTGTAFTRNGGEANYHEFYAGLALQRGAVRLFYSPAYYGEGRSAYLDVNAAYPLTERLHLALHAGLLHLFGAYPGASGGSDARIALGANVGDVSLEAGWQVKAHAYFDTGRPARALSARASMRF